MSGNYPHAQDKVLCAKKWLDTNGLDWNNAIAFANSWEDRFLLEKVKYPIVVNPDEELRKEAVERGWPIVNGGNYFDTYLKALEDSGLVSGDSGKLKKNKKPQPVLV